MTALKIAYILQHPIQYQSPFIRYLVTNGLSLTVYYGTLANASAYRDSEFGVTVEWDSDMLGGYNYLTYDPTKAPGLHRWLLEAWKKDKPDVVWVHGWGTDVARAAVRLANRMRIPVILRAETSLRSVQGPWYRRFLHRLYYRAYFKKFLAFLAVGTLNRQFYESYGVAPQSIFHVPYCVDNEHFIRLGQAVESRDRIRAEFGFTDDQVVFLFSGKLIAKKNPELILRAAELAGEGGPGRLGILMVGEGDRRSELEAMACNLIRTDVRFAGFRNQSELPAFYAACDAFILPSHFEPWGLVVNEALCASRPILLSNRIGCAPDLLREGENGFSFGSTSAEQLAEGMSRVAQNADWRKQAGQVSRDLIDHWSFQECHEGLVKALAHVKQCTHV